MIQLWPPKLVSGNLLPWASTTTLLGSCVLFAQLSQSQCCVHKKVGLAWDFTHKDKEQLFIQPFLKAAGRIAQPEHTPSFNIYFQCAVRKLKSEVIYKYFINEDG